MKKILILLAIILCFTLLFVSCDEEAPTENPSVDEPTNEKPTSGTEDGSGDSHTHTEQTVPEKPATCTEAGATESKICSECGEVLVPATTIPALEHTWTEATCIAPKTCSVCNATEGELGDHAWKDADCNNPRMCTVCLEQKGKPAGHFWLAATCDAPMSCQNCDATEGEALGHRWGNLYDSNFDTHWQKCMRADCDGTNAPTNHTYNSNYVCVTCGHGCEHKNVVVFVEATEPTCTQNGCTQGTMCEACNKIIENSTPIQNHGGHKDRDFDAICDNEGCGMHQGIKEWMLEINGGEFTTPKFDDTNSVWYITYVAPANIEFSIKSSCTNATITATVGGAPADINNVSMKKNDRIIIIVTRNGSDNSAVTFNLSSSKKVEIDEGLNVFAANQGQTSIESNGTDTYIKFVTSQGEAQGFDPYFAMNLGSFMDVPFANIYKYIVVKVNSAGCSGGSIAAYITTSENPGWAYKKGAEFIPALDEWHYVIINLGEWSGTLVNLRFDLDSTSSTNNTILFSTIAGFSTLSEAYAYAGVDIKPTTKPELTPEEEEIKNELLSGTTPDGGYESYKPETAENEDSQINLWFNHTYTRTPQSQVNPSNLFSYKLMLAKNEIEGCQLIVSSASNKTGLSISATNFVHTDGSTTMTSEILMGYYFEVEGEMVIDPVPPTIGNFATFNLNNTSQTFLVKAKSAQNQKAGEYSATVVIKDASGNEIKKVTVFAYVWNFMLPESTSCKTLMDMSAYEINVQHKDWTGEHNLYKKYYDFLLENRVCAYDVPGIPGSEGKYNDSVMEYLNNPRVVAFLNLGWLINKQTYTISEEFVSNSYNSLTNSDGTPKTDSEGTSLYDKSYFYPVDEPSSKDRLDAIKAKADLAKKYFGDDYNIIAPIHMTGHIKDANGNIQDYFSYLGSAVTAWCPKTFFFNTLSEYANNPNATQGTSAYAEKTWGTFAERMEAEKAGGDEVWWYVTRKPNNPETTLIINTEAVRYRVMFWQQKLYNVDGFLYYLVNDWRPASDNATISNKEELKAEFDATNAWYSKNEISTIENYSVYGNGVLIYPGVRVADDYYNAVGSLRLECVRDGIEDFEYFTMLEERIGKDKVDLIINEMATSVIDYSTDEEYFTYLREAIGALLESEMNTPNA